MNTETSAATDANTIGGRFREEVERAFQRTVKGIDYLTAPEPNVGVTPKHALYRRGTEQVVHYLPEVYRVPILLIPPPSNQCYGLDMLPGQSLVEYLLQTGPTSTCSTGTPRGPRRAHSGWAITC